MLEGVPSTVWNVPNVLSLTRVPLAGLFPFTVNRPIAALAVLAAAGVSDVLDGWWARSRGQVTTVGAVLDPITDKLFVGAVVVTLVVTGRLGPVAVLCLTTREIGEAPLVAWLALSPAMRAHRAKHAGANLLGKLVTLLQFACVTVAIAQPKWNVQRGLLAASAVFGVLSAVSYWRRVLRPPVAS
jgi:cardiolipin synthase